MTFDIFFGVIVGALMLAVWWELTHVTRVDQDAGTKEDV